MYKCALFFSSSGAQINLHVINQINIPWPMNGNGCGGHHY
uniref:Uncharacterized protein n=1 Tax=Rhizophora mucronata TaxID=61149 RepID=A0A2P2N2C2_RHIMU